MTRIVIKIELIFDDSPAQVELDEMREFYGNVTAEEFPEARHRHVFPVTEAPLLANPD